MRPEPTDFNHLHSNKLEYLFDQMKEYFTIILKTKELELVNHSSRVASAVFSQIVIAAVAFLFLIFLSLAAGFYISSLFGNNYAGFAIVAGFYMVLLFLLLIFKKEWMERPIQDRMIDKILENSEVLKSTELIKWERP